MILEVCWDALWTLPLGISQFHGHGSWLVGEVALSCYDVSSQLDSRYFFAFPAHVSSLKIVNKAGQVALSLSFSLSLYSGLNDDANCFVSIHHHDHDHDALLLCGRFYGTAFEFMDSMRFCGYNTTISVRGCWQFSVETIISTV
jgi:hypothetical protein